MGHNVILAEVVVVHVFFGDSEHSLREDTVQVGVPLSYDERRRSVVLSGTVAVR